MKRSAFFRLMAVLTAIVCVFSSLCIFASAEDCEHVWSDELFTVVEATCSSTGARAKKCTLCGAYDTTNQEIIPLLPHSFYLTSTVPASCSGDGVKNYKCANCPATKAETIPALPHSFGEWYVTKEPTCVAEGEKEHVCAVCKAHKTATIPATGEHTEVVIEAVAPTCTENGKTQSTVCRVCKQTLTKSESIPALGHEYGELKMDVFEASCTSKGVGHRYCIRCNASLRVETEKLPHSDSDGDGLCDVCAGDMKMNSCDCFCHRGGLVSIFTRYFDTLLSKITGKDYACCDDMDPLDNLLPAVMEYIQAQISGTMSKITDTLTPETSEG